MARYIELDQKKLKQLLREIQQFQDDITCAVGTDFMQKIAEAENKMLFDIIKGLENEPTADVVPRSEVEAKQIQLEVLYDNVVKLETKLDQADQEIERLKKKQTRYLFDFEFSVKMIPSAESVRQEVAREIFEEIDNFIESDRGKAICEDNSNDWFAKDRAKTFETYHNIGVENAKNTLRDFLDELKKKYIGE